MKTILIDGFTFNYDVVRNNSQKNPIIVRIKDKEYVVVWAHSNVSINEIEDVLTKKLDFLKERLPKTNKENVIHVKGIAYKPYFCVSGVPGVTIFADNIYISALTNDLKSYKKVLNDYYAYIIESELKKIMSEAARDFYEVKMPKITIEDFTGRFGDCDVYNRHIRLASRIAKYDPKYIKIVLYHELSHLYVANHSKKFYEVFESKMKNAKELDKSMDKIHYFDCL